MPIPIQEAQHLRIVVDVPEFDFSADVPVDLQPVADDLAAAVQEQLSSLDGVFTVDGLTVTVEYVDLQGLSPQA